MAKPQVLVVGGSLNGLTTALLLASQGIACLLVERHPATTIQYKFRGISPRSMEIYRALGIEDEIREQQQARQSGALVRGRNLSDPALQWGGPAWPDVRGISMVSHATCDQDRLEPILIKHAGRRGADIRFSTELTAFRQSHSGVHAQIRNLKTGEEEIVEVDYMVAADGANGVIRETLGIPVKGPGELQHWMNIIFATDLPRDLSGRRFTSAFVTDVNGSLVPRDDDGHWLLAIQYSPRAGERPTDFGHQRCTELIHKAVGRSQFTLKILDVRPWDVAAYVAERFADRRIFLVGDNVHRMPPTGGFGGNTGIHDAHNLAWKLALVLKGSANHALLDSYELERRPIAEATVAQALSRLAAWFEDPSKRLPAPVPIVDEYDVVFGQVYSDGAFISAGLAGARFEDCRNPTGRPGTRAPHLIIEARGAKSSIIDLYGGEFVLLAGPRGGQWRAAAEQVARRARVAITQYQLGHDLQDPEGLWPARYGVSEEGAVLIRPDGIVGWRARGRDEAPDSKIRAALAHILAIGE